MITIKNLYRYLLVLIALLVCIAGCINNQNEDFISEIPETLHNPLDDSLYRAVKKELHQVLRYETLENGFDSLKISITYNPAMLNYCKILCIQKDRHGFNSKLYRYHFKLDYPSSSFKITQHQDTVLSPKCGYNTLLDSLELLGLLQLKDFCSSALYKSTTIADGDSYSVEIATTRFYRKIYFHVPDYFCSKYHSKEAKQFINLLEFIKRQYSVRTLLEPSPIELGLDVNDPAYDHSGL